MRGAAFSIQGHRDDCRVLAPAYQEANDERQNANDKSYPSGNQAHALHVFWPAYGELCAQRQQAFVTRGVDGSPIDKERHRKDDKERGSMQRVVHGSVPSPFSSQRQNHSTRPPRQLGRRTGAGEPEGGPGACGLTLGLSARPLRRGSCGTRAAKNAALKQSSLPPRRQAEQPERSPQAPGPPSGSPAPVRLPSCRCGLVRTHKLIKRVTMNNWHHAHGLQGVYLKELIPASCCAFSQLWKE